MKLVGICCDAISGGVRLSDQAARSIGSMNLVVIVCHQASHLEAKHQLQNARQWQSWLDMHDCHPQLDGSPDHRSGGAIWLLVKAKV